MACTSSHAIRTKKVINNYVNNQKGECEMEIVDKTGQLRSLQDLEEAKKAIETLIIKDALLLPYLTVNAGIIRDALKECISNR